MRNAVQRRNFNRRAFNRARSAGANNPARVASSASAGRSSGS